MSIHHEAQLECNSEGSPAPLIFWTKEGSFDLMFPSSSHESYHVNSDASLVITDLKIEDQGYYYCTAVSIIGSAFGHSVLTVTSMETASPPIINFGPFDQFLREDSVAILPCEVSATTPAQIKWLFNGQPLSLNEHRFIVLNSGTLQIDGKLDQKNVHVNIKRQKSIIDHAKFEIEHSCATPILSPCYLIYFIFFEIMSERKPLNLLLYWSLLNIKR